MNYLWHWFNSYLLLLKWQLLRFKPLLPLLVVVQSLIGVGTVLGLGFLYPEVDSSTALFLVTGAPTLSLIVVGLVLVPQNVAMAKSEGTFDYIFSLPVPRLAFLFADLTIWLMAVIPSVILALIVGTVRYDFDLVLHPLAVPALLLTALTATTLGYALAHTSPSDDMVPVFTNFMVFCLFFFSPINFPIERLPQWLATLHRYLPVKYAAELVRGSLAEGYSDKIGPALVVLNVWVLVGFGVTYRAMTRRR